MHDRSINNIVNDDNIDNNGGGLTKYLVKDHNRYYSN